MYQNNRINLILPCFNEAAGLRKLLPAAPGFIDRVIVVDNNSTDESVSVCEEFDPVHVISENMQGYGAAYLAGFAACDADIIVAMDADATYPTQEITSLLDVLLVDSFDFVSGCRFPLKQKNTMDWINQVGNQLLTGMINMKYGLRLRDSQSGMWVFRRTILKQLNLQNTGMGLSQEIKIKAFTDPRIAATEVRIGYFYREGDTKLKLWRDGWMNLQALFGIETYD